MSHSSIVIDLGAPARIAELPVIASRVLQWWLGELHAMTPGWVTEALPKSVEPATLVVRDGLWRISAAGDASRAIELDPAVADSELAERILELAPGFSLSRLTVLLPGEAVLRRRIDLPVMADSLVRSAVELQIDRLSPFRADAVRFDTRTVSRDPLEGKLTIEVAIMRREPIEQLEQRLTALGLKLVAVNVTADGDNRAGFDLGARKQEARSRGGGLVTAGFLCSAAVLWMVALYAWGFARDREIATWQAAIAEVRPKAERSVALRRQLDALTAPLAMANGHRTGEVLGILAELTRQLPDNVRLTELRLSDDAIEFTGLAADSPSLIAKLEASKWFRDVKFRAPVTRRPELVRDRIEIAMKREGRGAP